MKLIRKLNIWLFPLVVGLLIGCQPGDADDLETFTVELTPEESENLLLKSSNLRERLRGQGVGGPMGVLFEISAAGGRKQSLRGESVLTSIRSLLGFKPTKEGRFKMPGCFTENFENTGNGGYRYEIDFGDGCDFFLETMTGKRIEEGSFDDFRFSGTTTYENFGGSEWKLNGTDSFSGDWRLEFDGIIPDFDDWAIVYTYESDIDQSLFVRVAGIEELFDIHYTGNGEEDIKLGGYEVVERNSSVSIANGGTYNTIMTTPLVMDYSCNNSANDPTQEVVVFSEGLEEGGFVDGTSAYQYFIDYGDGACDNLVSIDENGALAEINVLEEWYDIFD